MFFRFTERYKVDREIFSVSQIWSTYTDLSANKVFGSLALASWGINLCSKQSFTVTITPLCLAVFVGSRRLAVVVAVVGLGLKQIREPVVSSV